MGSSLKFVVDGDASQFDQMWRGVEATIARTSQKVLTSEGVFGLGSKLDAEKSRRADQEQASRSIKARALIRQRAAREAAKLEAEEVRKGLLLEQNLRDQAAVIEAQREESRRNIRARQLRRARAQEQADRLMQEIAGGSIPENMRGGRGGSGYRGGGGYAGPGGARAFGGASSAMFVSVARDSLASLASGANPMTVFLQQAPQVGQAFTMMGSKIASFLLPAGLVIAGLGGIAFAVTKASQGLGALGVKGDGPKLAAALDTMRQTLRARVEALKLEREEAQKILETRRAAAREGILDRGDKIGDLRVENRAMEAKTPEEAKKIRRDALKENLEAAKLMVETTKKDRYNTADPEKQKAADDAAIAYETAKNKLLQFDQRDTPGAATTNGRSMNMLTEWEKIGGSLGGNNLMLDVGKLQLKELQDINRHLRGGTGGRGVTF